MIQSLSWPLGCQIQKITSSGSLSGEEQSSTIWPVFVIARGFISPGTCSFCFYGSVAVEVQNVVEKGTFIPAIWIA